MVFSYCEISKRILSYRLNNNNNNYNRYATSRKVAGSRPDEVDFF
jgi:hypothetical protein